MKKQLAELTSQQLIKKLKREKNIDYIALVNSSWHFLSALSTIEWLKKKKRVEKGIILVFEHPADGYVIESELVNAKWYDGMEVYGFKFGALSTSSDVNKYLLNHRKEGRTFYILRPVMPKLEFSVMLYNEGIRKNIVHIVIEEGLATYMRDWKGWLFEDMKSFDFLEVCRQFSQRTWMKEVSSFALKRRGELIENIIFQKRSGTLVPNRGVVAYFKHTFSRMRNLYDFAEYDNYADSVIICTQTYGEQKRILENADIRVIRQICAELRKAGFRVIVKPHPREKNIKKYIEIGCEVDLRSDIPLESILAGLKVKPRCIMGITTTTLVTAKLFWNIPTVSMAKLIKQDKYSAEIIGEVNNFCRLFKDIVQVPEGYKQLKV